MDFLSEFRLDMRKQFDEDKIAREVEVRAATIQDALRDASIQLGAKVSSLDYEVLEKGSKGILGFAVKPWVLRIFENETETKKRVFDEDEIMSEAQILGKKEEVVEKIPDIDSQFFVRYIDGEILLKVTTPSGEGKLVENDKILDAIRRAEEYSFNIKAIEKYAKETTSNEYVPIGKYPNIADNDAKFTLDVSADEMTVTMHPFAPGENGSELSAKKIIAKMKSIGIVHGFCEDEIGKFIDDPIYNVPCVVARGTPEYNGNDAYMDFKFDTNPNTKRGKITEGGQVDFKELNITQNVVEGQVLAIKIPAEKGVPGTTVKGKEIPAHSGKDISLPLGKNTKVGDDGVSVVSTANGQVLLFANKVTVDPVLEVQGDVGIKTGNITFLGSVVVRGNVEDGFNIKASGNIEISGTVGASHLESDGDVIISLGVMGKDVGSIRAGGSIYAKFVQSTTLDADGDIVVGDGIINSNTTSKKRIIVQGKRAAIMGGKLFAMHEVNAKNIGSDSGGAETIIEVGYDPVKKKRLDELLRNQQALVKELEEVNRNMLTLDSQKKMQNFLPADKETQLQSFILRRTEIIEESDASAKEIAEIQEYLQGLKALGRVSASGTIYPGVKIFIRDLREDIRVPYSKVTFMVDCNAICQVAYVPPDEGESAGK